mmetsp:Transcript_6464/g.7463  ORF Transcript_6464/g.7463 Transcript_6464/m.7463 type:complete len:108 (+) Transcript_6464:107-430(+)
MQAIYSLRLPVTQGKDPKAHDFVPTPLLFSLALCPVLKISNVICVGASFTNEVASSTFGLNRKSTLLIDSIVSPGIKGALRSKPEELTFVTISLSSSVARSTPTFCP